mgnify:CR=1 FL=1
MYTKETSFSRRMKQAEQHAASLLQQILIFVLIFLVIFMMVQIQNLHGTAHVVNYAGLVRGASVKSSLRLPELQMTCRSSIWIKFCPV